MEIKSIRGSRTADNLAKSFAGESIAHMRYNLYAEIAREHDLPTLSDVFLATAHDERGHAEMFYTYLTRSLGEDSPSLSIAIPIAMGDTFANLIASAKSENIEWTRLYNNFGEIARAEGFGEIATSFFSIAEVERRHEARFRALAKRLGEGMLFESPFDVTWQCTNCGFRHVGRSALDPCPACHHPKSFAIIVD